MTNERQDMAFVSCKSGPLGLLLVCRDTDSLHQYIPATQLARKMFTWTVDMVASILEPENVKLFAYFLLLAPYSP